MSEPPIVCILGMHRSGTSLVSRVLNVLGLDLGPEEHLMGPSEANPSGHWESQPISDINDEILLRLGGSWWEPPVFAPGWERSPELAELRSQARDLIQADFSGRNLWGFKDPRNCLTAPFWQQILGPMRYVICLRNPVDVAASLEARNEEPVPFDQGLELWLTYVRATFAATAGHRSQLLFYEDLMADPEPVVARLARFIGHESEAAQPEARAAIRVAASEGLWHHRTAVPNVVDASRVPFHVKGLYMALRQFVPGPEGVGIEILDLLAGYAADAGRHLAELEADQAELDESRAELEKVREQSLILEREQAALEERLAERSAQLEGVTKERAEEQRLRRAVEAELMAARTALGPEWQPPAEDTASADGKSPSERAAYDRLVADVRERARELIPSEATALVATKGDDALLRLNGSRGLHFPIAEDGRYLGYHPAGDTAVIAQLEALRARGADHLLLPATMLWWLDHYEGLRRHLQDRYVSLLEDEVCAIYALRAPLREELTGPSATIERTVASMRMRSGRDPSILDWHTELGIADQFPQTPVFVPLGEEAVLPYLDGTVDIVVLASADATRIAEARRVAASAVIRVDPSFPNAAELEWLAAFPSGWGEDVSVTLIPDGDKAAWDATLGAFAETLGNGFAGELSVVDDSATLGPASERLAATGVRVRPIEVSPGASLAHRARMATEASDQRVHAFVTAPALPLPGWLPSILGLFSGDRDPGVVGTRILSPIGALAEAGGVLAADGSRRRWGEGDENPDRPEYCFVRRVDFCSPPLLATRRDLFERVGGFDERHRAPAEALVDFSLRAGQAGAPVYYQPHARVVAIGGGNR